MTAEQLLHERREEILRLARECGAGNVRLFGSAVRGEDSPKSDIDILVWMEDGRSLLDLIHFNRSLETLLQRRVDVVDEGGLSPYIRDAVLEEAKPL